MDIGQASDNELQKAIDDIATGAVNTSTVNELEAQIQNQMGVPPVPPVPEMQVPDMAPGANAMPPSVEGMMEGVLPQQPEVMPEQPVVAPVENVVEAPLADTAAPEVATVVPPVDTSADLNAVKGDIVRDLYPLLDKVEAKPEVKFNIIKEMMNETGDKSMIVKGYDVAKAIADEQVKAEALLYLFENA
jgi:hypothetical protein